SRVAPRARDVRREQGQQQRLWWRRFLAAGVPPLSSLLYEGIFLVSRTYCWVRVTITASWRRRRCYCCYYRCTIGNGKNSWVSRSCRSLEMWCDIFLAEKSTYGARVVGRRTGEEEPGEGLVGFFTLARRLEGTV
ncbi:unnamed protein product, partial [Ectocarpus sp. 12 AP-2014]